MVETSNIHSSYFRRKFAIHVRNVHLLASQKKKYKGFVYVCEDTACGLDYVGSDVYVCSRWTQTKKAFLEKNIINTGMYKHFMEVCPADDGSGNLEHLRWTLVDHLDT